jgi:murein DD-endopeptidase MepM/ murein hydrolase activator NlpD
MIFSAPVCGFIRFLFLPAFITLCVLFSQAVSHATITATASFGNSELLAQDLGASQTGALLKEASNFAFEGVSAIERLQLLTVKQDPEKLISDYMALMSYIPQAIALPSDEEAMDEPWLVQKILNPKSHMGLVFPNINPIAPLKDVPYSKPHPSALKILNPVQNAFISSPFGERWGHPHNGIDLAVPKGTFVMAAESGVVTYSGWQEGYGKIVEIDHGFHYTTRYAHCSKLMVKVGQQVSQGKIIARVGSTGHSTGPHLHFETLYRTTFINPEKLMNQTTRIVTAR